MKQKQKKLVISQISGSLTLLIFCVFSFSPSQKINAEGNSFAFKKVSGIFTAAGNSQQPQIADSGIIVKYWKNKIDLGSSAGQKKSLTFMSDKSVEKIDELDESNLELVKSPDSYDQTLANLKSDPNVEYAEPDYKKYPSVTNVNDPGFSQQWNLSMVKMPQAWDIENSSSNKTVVAVVDSGVYYNHEDLLSNMWNGSTSCVSDQGVAISGGCPNHGWDFKDGDNDPQALSWMVGTEDIGPHGTWVSGVIAATSNNSIGISGMSHNNNLKIMAVRFGLDTFTELQAINFAKNNGAKVINASWGGPDFSQAEEDAISSFPGIFVAAAGNESTNNETTHTYPSDYPLSNIISVAATDETDSIASFSNYGAVSVDIAAPGADIPTTYYSGLTDYASVSGTSFSTPMVAGAAALLYNKNPNLTPAQVKNDILTSGDPLLNNGDSAKVLSGKRLDVYNALLMVTGDTTPPAGPSSLSVN